MTTPWDSFLTEQDRAVIARGRFGRRMGFGERCAVIVIDAQFTLADGKRLADAVLATKKNLTQVLAGRPAIRSTQKTTESTGITGPNGTLNPRCRSGSR